MIITKDDNKMDKIPVSILIPTYNNVDYIKDCLDSIERQSYFKNNDNYEILIGIDGCKKTLKYLLKIKDNYRNINLYMMDSNKGCYVTTNTLFTLSKYKDIIRFDSDDIMKDFFVEAIMLNSNKCDAIRYLFEHFSNNDLKNTRLHNVPAMGSLYMKRYVYDTLGGYRDWRCSADLEFNIRAEKKFKFGYIKNSLFYYRNHINSLCHNPRTTHGSDIRRNYESQIKRDFEEIKPVINTYKKIS
jgi:glycosyltransferase involved in cell wall biosynthesis